MRVLYVDDHTPFRAVVQRRFLAGHDVVGAGTLAEAREHLAARAFDYVLLEYSLPDGKATELICEIREKCLPCKVVAVSQNLEHNAEMVTAGADGVVMKNEFTRLADRLANLEHDQ